TVLMGATALMTALAGMQLAKAYMSDSDQAVAVMQAPVTLPKNAPDTGHAKPVAVEPAGVSLAARMAEEPSAADLSPSADDIDAMIEETVSSALAAPIVADPMANVKMAAVTTVAPAQDVASFAASDIEVPADAGPEPLRDAA